MADSKKIETLDDLAFDSHNANKGTATGQKLVAKSIEDYGAGRSIVADKHGTVIGGNKTLQAARDAGLDVEVIRTSGDKLIVHQREDLSLDDGDKARLLAYADNRSSELGLDWDAGVLTEDIGNGIDLSGLFDEKALDAIGVDIGDPDDPPEAQMDAAEALQEKWQVNDGDVWQIGEHRLMCGDCVKERTGNRYTSTYQGSFLKDDTSILMGEAKADMIHTDPPYNVAYGTTKNPRHKIREIENDNLSDSEWESFCKTLFGVFEIHAKGDIYMWGASGPDGMRMRLWLVEAGAHWSATIVWKKQQLVLSPAKYQRMYEPCFYGWFGKSSYCGDRKQTEVWCIDRPHSSKLHPTMKPIELCEMAIKNSSERGSIVLDTFLGSGSTMVAAEQLGRKCYGMEIEPKYCAVILERMTDMGLTPELVSNAREET
jgi:DNA modification methylase